MIIALFVAEVLNLIVLVLILFIANYFRKDNEEIKERTRKLNEEIKKGNDQVAQEMDNLDKDITRIQNGTQHNTENLIDKYNLIRSLKIGDNIKMQLPNGMKVSMPFGAKKSVMFKEMSDQGVEKDIQEYVWKHYAEYISDAMKFDKRV